MTRLLAVVAAVIVGIAAFAGELDHAWPGQPVLWPLSPAQVLPPTFSRVDDYQQQLDELWAYIREYGLSPTELQEDLASHPKHYQYAPAIVIAYGNNACGPVAAAGAFGGATWMDLVGVVIANAPPKSYSPNAGIQPEPFTAALEATFGTGQVSAENGWTLGDLYVQLRSGNVVIVDVQVGRYDNPAGREFPTTTHPNYSHFARVLGINLDAGEIYIENTLMPVISSVWTVPLSTFWETWRFPEKSVSLRVPGYDPRATRWAVVIQSQAQPVG
jgi:hypothetical protein